MNNAPIDIVINIIERMKKECNQVREDSRKDGSCNESYFDGSIDALNGLQDQLEGFKRLFN